MKINLLTVTWLATCCELVLSFRQHHFQNPSSSDAEFQLKSIVQFGYHKHPSKSLKLTGKSTNSILSILDLEDSSEEEYTAQNLEKFHIDEDVIWSEDSAFSAFSNELRIPRKDPSKDLGYRRAVLNLAKMAGHAYKPQPKKPWKDLDPGWNVNASFGWDDDRIRGYVFGNTENTKLIVAIKGTTFNFLGFSKSFMGGMLSPIGRNDRKMDNIMFSCCCGAISGNWRPVCSCGRGTNLCKQSCLEEHAVGETTYYHGAMLIYDALIQRYPKSKISFTGHSLGGALASLMGLTTNLPAFTFEAPGDLLYAQRAKLTQDYKAKNLVPPILHFGNNADPIYTGTCNGKMSLCYLGGYGMDSKCHTGLKCTFDTKEGKDWSPSLIHHRLPNVINNILEDWAEGSDDTKLNCSFEEDCQDCEAWKFI